MGKCSIYFQKIFLDSKTVNAKKKCDFMKTLKLNLYVTFLCDGLLAYC